MAGRRTAGVAVAVAAAWAVGAADAHADAPGAFRTWLERSTTLEGRFEQTLLSSALGTGPSETGRLYLARPGRARWEYESPEPKSALVLDGRTLVHLPADRQLLRGRLEEDSVLPRLLAGGSRFDDGFAVEDLGPGARKGTHTLALVPKGSAGGLVKATVTVRDRTGELEEAEIVDAAGNRMLYRFSEWRRNRPLPEGIFSLEPPAGTEIVDLD